MPTLQCNSGSYSLIGAPAFRALVLSCVAGAYTLTGTAVTFGHGYTLAAASGSYTHTGVAIQTKRISAEPAGYLIQGKAVTLSVNGNRFVSADSGSYTLTGTTATRLERAVPILLGAYNLTGTPANLLRSGSAGNTLAAVGGSYTITGGMTRLQSTITIFTGDYNLTGTAATLRRGKRVAALGGTYALGGQQVITKRGYRFPALSSSYAIQNPALITLVYNQSGSKFIVLNSTNYTLTGSAVTPVVTRYLSAESGNYTLSGQSVLLGSILPAVSGTYGLVGTPAILSFGSGIITATSGSYGLTGQPAILHILTYRIVAVPGSYSLGTPTTAFHSHFVIAAQRGTYTSTGISAFLRVTHIVANPGQYALGGQPATLRASRSGRWRTRPPHPGSGSQQVQHTSNWSKQPVAPEI